MSQDEILLDKVKTRDPEGTKRAILDAAEKLFAEKGFSGVSVRDISEASGVSQSLIHHHFGSKNALYEEVKKRAIDRFWHRWLNRSKKMPHDLGFLADGVETFFWFVRDNETIMRLSCWACLEGDTDLWPGEKEAIEYLSQEIKQAQERGLIRSDINALMLTILIQAASIFWWQYRPNFVKLFEELGKLPENIDEWYLKNITKVLLCGVLKATPEIKPEKGNKDQLI